MVSASHYSKNLEFWEEAWSRVKNLYKEPNKVDYLDEIYDVLKKHNVDTVLDIACGSGWLSVYLNGLGFKPTGIDVSPSAIKLAHKWIEEDSLKDIDFKVMDMMDLAFPDDNFDAIVVNSTFEHLDLERGAQFFKNVKKVIKPNGILFGAFDEVCKGSKGEYETLDDGSRLYTDDMRKGMLLRNFTDDELDSMLSEANWEILSKRTNEMGTRVVWAKNLK